MYRHKRDGECNSFLHALTWLLIKYDSFKMNVDKCNTAFWRRGTPDTKEFWIIGTLLSFETFKQAIAVTTHDHVYSYILSDALWSLQLKELL
jgi:hypothetical protein